jgi:hypothetical protein
MTDMYTRPSRDEIAAELGIRPGADDGLDDVVTHREPEPLKPAQYLRNFAIHLNARMRALGWDQTDLQREAGIATPRVTAKAMNGTGVALDIAAGIARAVGSHLPAMLGPYVCTTCEGTPPPGYQCMECDTEGERL